MQNLQLFRILAEENCILVRGSVPGARERLRRRDQGRDAHRVQAQGRGQGRGSLEEPAQGLEEGGCGSRLSRLPAVAARPALHGDRAFSFMSKRLDDRDTRHDRFHQKAKQEGFLARAVYKLEEIDQKHKIFDARATACSTSAARRGRGCSTPRSKIGDRARARRARSRARCRVRRPGRADRRRRRADDRPQGAAAATLPAFDVVLSRHGARHHRHPQPRSGALRGAVRACARDRDARARPRRQLRRQAVPGPGLQEAQRGRAREVREREDA